MKTTIIFAHPNVENGSVGNKIILDRIKTSSDIDVREIYKLYPDRMVDIEREQQAIKDSGLIIFQFPLFWFSIPSLLKEWLDQVFSRDFAYGPGANGLHGKEFMISVTVGGSKSAYSSTGHFDTSVEDYLKPLKKMAAAVGMTYLEPIMSHGISYDPKTIVESERKNAQQLALTHADRLMSLLDTKIA